MSLTDEHPQSCSGSKSYYSPRQCHGFRGLTTYMIVAEGLKHAADNPRHDTTRTSATYSVAESEDNCHATHASSLRTWVAAASAASQLSAAGSQVDCAQRINPLAD